MEGDREYEKERERGEEGYRERATGRKRDRERKRKSAKEHFTKLKLKKEAIFEANNYNINLASSKLKS